MAVRRVRIDRARVLACCSKFMSGSAALPTFRLFVPNSSIVAKQTTALLESHFHDAVSMLRDACDAFDEGATYQAKQIATVIRTLLHDTAKSHALLVQLAVRDSWQWVDTSEEVEPTNLMPTFGLVKVTYVMPEDGPSSQHYEPLLDEYPRIPTSRMTAFSRLPATRLRGETRPFDYWWTNPVLRDHSRKLYTRKALVLGLANFEGGTHVSPTVPAHYLNLAHGGSMSFPINNGDGTSTWHKTSPIPAAVRQVGFEVLKTVDAHAPGSINTPA